METYVLNSKEYLKVQVVSDVALTTQAVEIKLDGTWRSAAWLGSAGTTRTAAALTDFASVAVGRHTVYVRITDSPEIPILNAGLIMVRA